MNSCCCGNLPVCILRLIENGLEKYRLAKKWEQFKIVLFMDHPVFDVTPGGSEYQRAVTRYLSFPSVGM